MSKEHLLQHKAFRISMYLQSLICTLAQGSVFEEASNILKKILNLDVSAKQFQRVSEWYGAQLDPIIEANHVEYIPQLVHKKDRDEYTYVMLDGCMIFTRSDEWKENKLARIFHESKNVEIQKNRNEIIDNVYVSHLGSIDAFLPKLERHISLVKGRKVFIADGAKWIWNWVEDNYPGSIQIVDYYHAVEKLEDLAKHHFIESIKRKEWLEKQKQLLLNDQVFEVIQNIQGIKAKIDKAIAGKQSAQRYFIEHEDRMMYKTYREKGLLIGSGPIEATHRNVIQHRMKLSGQKWSIDGANSIANLRCYHKSNAWSIIDKLIKLAA